MTMPVQIVLPAAPRYRARRVLAAVCVAILLSGCQTMNNREAGTVIGAAAGGIAGAFFGKGAGKVAAVALGSVIGGVIGNQVGAALDEQQKAALAQTTANTLNAARDGETIVWNDGRAQAQITPGNTRYQPKNVVVVRDRRVEPPRGLQIVGADYRATAAAPVRVAAERGAETVTTLRKGETIHMVGRVEGTGYALVARNRKSIGYVETAKLEAAPKQAAVQSAGASVPGGQTATAGADAPALRQGVNLDDPAPDTARAAAAAQGIDLDADNAVAEKLVASVPCRDLTTTVRVEGQSETASSTVCKASDGAWEL